MASSNERGRAFEWAVRNEILDFAKSNGLKTEATAHTKERDAIEKSYFDELSTATQQNFISGAKAFTRWMDQQGWLDDATKLVLDRVPDNVAKLRDPTDIRLEISYKDSKSATRNISVKHQHDALCHPRLPSLAQQCGIEKGGKIDRDYRKRYHEIWEKFHENVKKLGGNITTTTYLKNNHPGFIAKHFLVPMQKHVVAFLEKHANDPKHAEAYFKYLVGDLNYYVLKNMSREIEVKCFAEIKSPRSFKITCPYEGDYKFLIEFDNGWKIRERLHTASSRLLKKDGSVFMSEKEDPICINLGDVIKIDKIQKKV